MTIALEEFTWNKRDFPFDIKKFDWKLSLCIYGKHNGKIALYF